MRIIDAHAHVTAAWEELGIFPELRDSLKPMDHHQYDHPLALPFFALAVARGVPVLVHCFGGGRSTSPRIERTL